MGTVHGEDLPYVFGAPLVDGFSHFPRNYTKSEVALSEAVMIFWSNFARTGNPNEHHRQDSVLMASKERNRFRSIVWDEYDSTHQKYLEIGKHTMDRSSPPTSISITAAFEIVPPLRIDKIHFIFGFLLGQV